MKKKSTPVTAFSEVAVCERRVYLRAKLGERTTVEIERQRAQGRRLHKRAESQQAPHKADARCFVASAVYGPDAWQTNRLRRFRDEVLTPTVSGRLLTRAYYLLSPPFAHLARRAGPVRAVARRALDALIRSLP